MNKNDKRYIETEELILNVFSKLVYEKGFDKVTVSDITKAAGISRGAFYIHYEDKYALLSHCESSVLDDLKEIYNDIINVENINMQQKLIHFFTVLIIYYKDNYKLAKALLYDTKNSELEKWIRKMVGTNFLKNYCSVTGKDNLPVSLEYLSVHLYYSHLGIISQWFDSGMKEPPKKIAELITNLSFNGVFNI